MFENIKCDNKYVIKKLNRLFKTGDYFYLMDI